MVPVTLGIQQEGTSIRSAPHCRQKVASRTWHGCRSHDTEPTEQVRHRHVVVLAAGGVLVTHQRTRRTIQACFGKRLCMVVCKCSIFKWRGLLLHRLRLPPLTLLRLLLLLTTLVLPVVLPVLLLQLIMRQRASRLLCVLAGGPNSLRLLARRLPLDRHPLLRAGDGRPLDRAICVIRCWECRSRLGHRRRAEAGELGLGHRHGPTNDLPARSTSGLFIHR